VTDRSGGQAGTADAGPRIEVGFATDVGQVRTGNEDSVLCEPLESLRVTQRGLFCGVADGMGGHAAGEVASSIAVKVACDTFYETTSDADPLDVLRLAVEQANTAVFEAGAGKTGRDHMGSTLTVAVLFNQRVVIGHVGDSRAYIVQNDTISQVSRDHSWVAEEVEAGRLTAEQARIHPRRNIVTRALGLRPEVDVEAYEAKLVPGNIVVICSDGLHGLVTDDEIVSHVRRLRPVDAVDALVKLANDRGGPDNISVVVARVLGAEDEEADTERDIPVLTETYAPTSTADLSEPQPDQPVPLPGPSTAELAPAASAPDHESTPPAGPTSAEAAPAGSPSDVQPAPLGVPMSAEAAPPAEPTSAEPVPSDPLPEPPSDHAPQAPSSPSEQTPATPSPERQSSRGGGIALIAVLVLLVILGSAIGYLLFSMAGMIP
jgi:protein phosphatase